jgi:hypothetical protein
MIKPEECLPIVEEALREMVIDLLRAGKMNYRIKSQDGKFTVFVYGNLNSNQASQVLEEEK